jgi:hypothetical protein
MATRVDIWAHNITLHTPKNDNIHGIFTNNKCTVSIGKVTNSQHFYWLFQCSNCPVNPKIGHAGDNMIQCHSISNSFKQPPSKKPHNLKDHLRILELNGFEFIGWKNKNNNSGICSCKKQYANYQVSFKLSCEKPTNTSNC